MNGLIIKPKWLDRIILYGKDIEVRGSITNHVGEKIYLLEKGTCKCVAVANLECSGAIRDEEHWEFLKPRHQIDKSWEAITKIYKQPCFWYLKRPHIIEPFIYRHPKGAVIWVKDVEKLRIEDVGPVYGRL